MRSRRPLIGLAFLGFVLGSFPLRSEAGPSVCPLAGERPLQVAHFFFGRAIKGRQPVTDGEWTAFAAEILSHNFPDGFTSYDGDGQWLDPKTGKIVRERSKVVMAAVNDSVSLEARIRAVSQAYQKRFRQESVGVTTEEVCGAF